VCLAWREKADSLYLPFIEQSSSNCTCINPRYVSFEYTRTGSEDFPNPNLTDHISPVAMPHDLQIVLDPPLRGFYTYQDTVSGKVIFESAQEEKIGWVYVFFHGCVNIEFNIREEESPVYKCMDNEVLFQQCQKVYEGHEKLLEKVRHELPFKFAFRAERGASSLPISGKYHYSSVEYKVTAVPRRIGQTEDQIMSMMNPYNPPFPKKVSDSQPDQNIPQPY
jgi:hypothetical protein